MIEKLRLITHNAHTQQEYKQLKNKKSTQEHTTQKKADIKFEKSNTQQIIWVARNLRFVTEKIHPSPIRPLARLGAVEGELPPHEIRRNR